MKKFKCFGLALLFVLVGIVGACNGNKEGETVANHKEDKRVTEAIEVLSNGWKEVYANAEFVTSDHYLEIINTRIINIKENIDPKQVHEKNDLFDDLDYIVEFELMSNYWGSSPYYPNVCLYGNVVKKKDGTAEVIQYSLLNSYRASVYDTDFSPIIESIENFHGEYDGVIELH